MDQTGILHRDAPSHGQERLFIPARPTVLERRLALAFGLTALWLLLLTLFFLIPAIDIDIQRLFFRPLPCPVQPSEAGHAAPAVCGLFPLAQATTLQVFRSALFNAPTFLGIALSVALMLIRAGRLQANAAFRQRAALLVATLCLGPGLLVNAVLKEHSGRPRPAEVDLFGGSMAFRPAGRFDGACSGNCSFLSGEAAGLAWLVLATVLLPAPARRIATPLVAMIAAVGIVLRMGFGRHFLSDIVLGALSTPLVDSWLLVAAVILPHLSRFAGQKKPNLKASPKSHQ